MVSTWLPFLSSAISFLFTAAVFQRYWRLRKAHLLLWGIGLAMYCLGGLCEALYGAFGWNELVFRLWYLSGAMLVAAWLGQGTVYLLAPRRVANVLMAILLLGSIYGAFRIFSAELEPSLMIIAGELSGHAIITKGVRILTPFFNTYGLITLVGGALYSAWIFWRRRVLLNRVIGNILIAVGAMAPAFGGVFSRLGVSEYLYLGEFLGVILMFTGFLKATVPVEVKNKIEAPQISKA